MILGIKDNVIKSAQLKGNIPGMDETREVDSFSFDWIGFPLTDFDWTDKRNPKPNEIVLECEQEMKLAEIESEKNKIKEEIRNKRDQLLTETDWTQIPDVPTDKEAWANYRQALRDIPQQEGFPENIEWPQKPE